MSRPMAACMHCTIETYRYVMLQYVQDAAIRISHNADCSANERRSRTDQCARRKMLIPDVEVSIGVKLDLISAEEGAAHKS